LSCIKFKISLASHDKSREILILPLYNSNVPFGCPNGTISSTFNCADLG